MRITIENQEQYDPSSLFRVTLNDRLISENLTAAQAHILVGDIFEKALGPKRPSNATAGNAEPHAPRVRT